MHLPMKSVSIITNSIFPLLAIVNTIQLYFLRRVSGFLLGTQVSCTEKTDSHDITAILLKEKFEDTQNVPWGNQRLLIEGQILQSSKEKEQWSNEVIRKCID